MIDRLVDPATIDPPNPQQTPLADAPHALLLPLLPQGEDCALYVPGLRSLHNWGKAPFPGPPLPGDTLLFQPKQAEVSLQWREVEEVGNNI